MATILDGAARAVFRAVTETVVPAASELDAGARRRSLEIVETALSDRSPELRRQLRLFLRLVRWGPVLRWGRTFPRLSPGRRARFFGWLQDAPILQVRRGAWGLRTLALMGYYGLPEVRRRIGYRAHPRGWTARRVREGKDDGEALEPGPEVQL